jgi:hypothetical protein
MPNSQLNRYATNNGPSSQALQQYFNSQQHQMQPKFDVRTTKNVHIFSEKLGNVR